MMGTVKAAITGGPSSPLCFPISRLLFNQVFFPNPLKLNRWAGFLPAARALFPKPPGEARGSKFLSPLTPLV